MRAIITETMKKELYAIEMKKTYTYRIFVNANGEVSITVQKTKDFKNGELNESICTMTRGTFKRLFLEDINWIVDFLRLNARFECTLLECYVDEGGLFHATTDLGSLGMDMAEKQLRLEGENGYARI